jgi:type VI secretion system protein ImpH
MATSQWSVHFSIEQALYESPSRFSFAQAMRLLEALNFEKSRFKPEWKQFPVGYYYSASRELVHFYSDMRAIPHTTDITDLEAPVLSVATQTLLPAKMTVSIMGLTGSKGVLPQHYNEDILLQRRKRNRAMEDFFNIFDHRVMSFYYRAIQKHSIPLLMEMTPIEGKLDTMTRIFSALTGMPSSRKSAIFPIKFPLYYASFFADRRRSAYGLEQLLSSYFKVPVQVIPFVGNWNRLSVTERSRLGSKPGAKVSLGQHHILGKGAVLGSYFFNSQSHCRIQIGPLPFERYQEFLPHRKKAKMLKALIREFIGTVLEFDIELISEPASIPALQLDRANRPQLGYYSWLGKGGSLVKNSLLRFH